MRSARAWRRAGLGLLVGLGVACGGAQQSVAQQGGGGASANAPAVALEPIAGGFVSPVAMAVPGDGSGRRFIVDQIGLVRVIDAAGNLREEPWLDLRDRVVELSPGYDERGLLGLAFHPRFEENGRLFVYYSGPLREDAPEGYNHTSYLSELRVPESGAARVDPATERVLLAVDQPQSNHNGGTIAFGPEGNLYLSLGDGGGGGDAGPGHPPLGNGQDVTTLLGSILRIDVDGEAPYEIPTGNPFVGQEGRDEIYAYGFRNPYRFSFDRQTGELLAADVGENEYEEVNVVERGGNYGWNIMEGAHCFESAPCADEGPRGRPLRLPVIEYPHSGGGAVQGISVIGGYVYRGDDIPGLAGRYVFGDWRGGAEGGALFFSEPDYDAEGLWGAAPLVVEGSAEGGIGRNLLAFGQDEEGELYVLTSERSGPSGETGRVFRLVAP